MSSIDSEQSIQKDEYDEYVDIVSEFRGHKTININSREYCLSHSMYRYAVLHGLITPLTEEQKNAHKWQTPIAPGLFPRSKTYRESNLTQYRSGRVSRQDNGYSLMTDDQKKHFVESIINGCGPPFACNSCGISWSVYTKTLSQDKDFRDSVAGALRLRDDTLDTDIRLLARSSESLADKLAVRKVMDEIKRRGESKRFEERRVRVQEKLVDGKLAALDHVVRNNEVSNANFKNLTPDEVLEYSQIFKKIRENKDVSHIESMRYIDLTRKISTPLPGSDAKMLSDISTFDKIVQDDENG